MKVSLKRIFSWSLMLVFTCFGILLLVVSALIMTVPLMISKLFLLEEEPVDKTYGSSPKYLPANEPEK